ncbi:MAG: hypothetical protein V1731_00985 [Candidatus Aenigmatarchaeota archaeon]
MNYAIGEKKKMKGFSLAAIGPPLLIIIGISLVFIIGRNTSTEEYLHSYRAREAFSTLNHLEFAKKTFDGWMDFAASAATLELGRAGLGADESHSKDGVAIWTPNGPTDAETKSKLTEGIKSKVGALGTVQIEGKYALIDYTKDLTGEKPTEIELKILGQLSDATYFDVTGDRPFKVVKDIEKQAIYYAADSAGIINQRISSSFFKIFAFARNFLAGGSLTDEITSALAGARTSGTVARDGCAMYAPSTCESGCPILPEPSYATPEEVFASANIAQPFLNRVKSIKNNIGGEFSAKIEVDEPSIKIKAGYQAGDIDQQSASCSYSCSYSEDETYYVCVPDVNDPPACTCNPDAVNDTLPLCPDEARTRTVTRSRSCDGVVRTTTIDFTLLADAYLKYSSEDDKSLVPSDTLNPATGLPFTPLEFNYATHVCSSVKSGSVATTFMGDILNCRLEGSTLVG